MERTPTLYVENPKGKDAQRGQWTINPTLALLYNDLSRPQCGAVGLVGIQPIYPCPPRPYLAKNIFQLVRPTFSAGGMAAAAFFQRFFQFAQELTLVLGEFDRSFNGNVAI